MQKYIHWLTPILSQSPHAIAHVRGSSAYPALHGIVQFYQTRRGVVVTADFVGLPEPAQACRNPVFALHIHTGTDCRGNTADPFANAEGHFNPEDCPHPYHAGDMPPVFAASGQGFTAFLTDRFAIEDISGRTVILHSMPDDFTSQPAGAAGEKIACGEIRPV